VGKASSTTATGSARSSPGRGSVPGPYDRRPPYALGPRGSVLILDAGTCSLVSQALNRGAERITAVEPHPRSSHSSAGAGRGDRRSPRHPAVSVRTLSSRTFLTRDRSQYDLILLPTLDAFGGTSGLHAVREDYLLTRETLRQVWRKLTPGGVISVTSWMDYPVRHPLKIAATLAEALEAEGVADLRDHLAAVRGWGRSQSWRRRPRSPPPIIPISGASQGSSASIPPSFRTEG